MSEIIEVPIRELIEARVRGEYEDAIKVEVDRRLEITKAAIEGRMLVPVEAKKEEMPEPQLEPVKRFRRPRCDRGLPRVRKTPAAIPWGGVEPGTVTTEPHLSTQTEREEMFEHDASAFQPDPDSCATCHHAEHVHGDDGHGGAAGCMAIECKCRRFVAPDPLGVDDHDPKEESHA